MNVISAELSPDGANIFVRLNGYSVASYNAQPHPTFKTWTVETAKADAERELAAGLLEWALQS